jgi:hypothetical protein
MRLGSRVPRWQVEQARRRLSRTSHTRIQLRGGAICFPQRFGGSLNLNVHYHVAVPDGVFVRPSNSEGSERLLRYCARAPLSLEQLTVLPDGRIAYRIKAPRGRRPTAS